MGKKLLKEIIIVLIYVRELIFCHCLGNQYSCYISPHNLIKLPNRTDFLIIPFFKIRKPASMQSMLSDLFFFDQTELYFSMSVHQLILKAFSTSNPQNGSHSHLSSQLLWNVSRFSRLIYSIRDMINRLFIYIFTIFHVNMTYFSHYSNTANCRIFLYNEDSYYLFIFFALNIQ